MPAAQDRAPLSLPLLGPLGLASMLRPLWVQSTQACSADILRRRAAPRLAGVTWGADCQPQNLQGPSAWHWGAARSLSERGSPPDWEGPARAHDAFAR